MEPDSTQAGDYRVLRRVLEISRYATEVPATVVRRGLIVDIETTGLDPARDKIIELALLPFNFSSEGGLYAVQEGYAGFEDPGAPLPELVTRLTGITDDVRGQRLDDETYTVSGKRGDKFVNKIFNSQSHVIRNFWTRHYAALFTINNRARSWYNLRHFIVKIYYTNAAAVAISTLKYDKPNIALRTIKSILTKEAYGFVFGRFWILQHPLAT